MCRATAQFDYGRKVSIPLRLLRPIAPQPLVDIVRNGDDRAAEMITRSVYRESKFPFPSLNRPRATASVLRDLFPRVEKGRVHDRTNIFPWARNGVKERDGP